MTLQLGYFDKDFAGDRPGRQGRFRLVSRTAFRIVILFSILTPLLSGAFLLGEQAAERLVKGPVINNVQKDRATLTWVTARAAGELDKAAGGSARTIHMPVYHELELTGLEPGTRYTHRFTQFGEDVSVTFTTAPAKPEPFMFIAYGDTRTGHDLHRQVVERIREEGPAFAIHTGDLVNNGLTASDWDIFFDISRELLRSVPFFPALGNHERNAPVYFKYFAFPQGNGRYYSFDWGGAHFVFIDTNDIGDTARQRAEFQERQTEWLRDDLRRNKLPLTFVVFHHPLYTAVESRQTSAARLAERLESVLVEGGVTAVLNGHDHNYQHHFHSGIHHIVTGGGGAPLYPVAPVPGITIHAVSTENYVRVRVDGDKATVEAVDLAGKILESFEMEGRKAAQPATKPAVGF